MQVSAHHFTIFKKVNPWAGRAGNTRTDSLGELHGQVDGVRNVCMLSSSVVSDSDPRDYSLPGFSVYGDSVNKNARMGSHFLLKGIFLTQGLNPCLLHWQADSLLLSHLGSPE